MQHVVQLIYAERDLFYISYAIAYNYNYIICNANDRKKILTRWHGGRRQIYTGIRKVPLSLVIHFRETSMLHYDTELKGQFFVKWHGNFLPAISRLSTFTSVQQEIVDTLWSPKYWEKLNDICIDVRCINKLKRDVLQSVFKYYRIIWRKTDICRRQIRKMVLF